MSEDNHAAAESGERSGEKQVEPRTPRSIRFFDSEWVRIEQEARARGMNATEPVHHAAVSSATGKLMATSEAFPPDIAAQVERMFRGVYVLSTPRRDEMIREGQQGGVRTYPQRCPQDAGFQPEQCLRQIGMNGTRDDRNPGTAARTHRRSHAETAFPALQFDSIAVSFLTN